MARSSTRPARRWNLANMRRQRVQHLIAYCLNDACRHQAIIDVSSYPDGTPVPWFQSKVKCGKCSARGRRIDVPPNWKEAPGNARQLGSAPPQWAYEIKHDGVRFLAVRQNKRANVINNESVTSRAVINFTSTPPLTRASLNRP